MNRVHSMRQRSLMIIAVSLVVLVAGGATLFLIHLKRRESAEPPMEFSSVKFRGVIRGFSIPGALDLPEPSSVKVGGRWVKYEGGVAQVGGRVDKGPWGKIIGFKYFDDSTTIGENVEVYARNASILGNMLSLGGSSAYYIKRLPQRITPLLVDVRRKNAAVDRILKKIIALKTSFPDYFDGFPSSLDEPSKPLPRISYSMPSQEMFYRQRNPFEVALYFHNKLFLDFQENADGVFQEFWASSIWTSEFVRDDMVVTVGLMGPAEIEEKIFSILRDEGFVQTSVNNQHADGGRCANEQEPASCL